MISAATLAVAAAVGVIVYVTIGVVAYAALDRWLIYRGGAPRRVIVLWPVVVVVVLAGWALMTDVED